MGRARKKPNYDPEKILNEILDNVVAAYEQLEQIQRTGNQLAYGALKELSDAVEMNPSKVKKLLITAGERDNREVYGNDASRLVLSIRKSRIHTLKKYKREESCNLRTMVRSSC